MQKNCNTNIEDIKILNIISIVLGENFIKDINYFDERYFLYY